MQTIPITVKPDRLVDGPLSEPSLDLERSKGGNSCCYHWCEVTQRRDNYGVCLYKLDVVRDRPDEAAQLIPQCMPAITAGTCPALKMRAEEIAKGHSIYFYSREEQLAANAERDGAAKENAVVRYGRRSGLSMPKFVPTDSESLREVGDTQTATKTARTPAAKSDGFDADLASRNLIGDAINRSL